MLHGPMVIKEMKYVLDKYHSFTEVVFFVGCTCTSLLSSLGTIINLHFLIAPENIDK